MQLLYHPQIQQETIEICRPFFKLPKKYYNFSYQNICYNSNIINRKALR